MSQPVSQLNPQASVRPAGFWIRFIAYFLDSLIIGFLSLPVTIGLQFAMFSQMGNMDPEALANASFPIGLTIVSWIINLAIMGTYGGWFYSRKGATPGKMIFGLEVIDAQTGSYLSFQKGALRDSIGKLISSVVLLIGYIMAAFHPEKAAFHDLLVGSRVIRK